MGPTHKMYGFHEGQWGKPPVDEHGQPLYGDPFGIWTEPISNTYSNRMRWGILEQFELSEDEEESEEEEEEEENEHEQHHVMTQPNKQQIQEGIQSNASSVISNLQLRKDTIFEFNIDGVETPGSTVSENQNLYQVLKEKENVVRGKFGSSQVYEMPTNQNGQIQTNSNKKRKINENEQDGNQPPAKRKKT